MSGHSKWNNIKNRKGAMDAKKGKVFSEIGKLIRIAVKEGASDDPAANPRLRIVLEKARAANMPKDNIQRALDKGMGRGAEGRIVQEILYEAFGPGGAALIIETVTDNPNKMSSEIKYALSRNGGSLASPNAAQYLFKKENVDGSLQFVPAMDLPLSEKDREALETLVDAVKEVEDVEAVYTTAG